MAHIQEKHWNFLIRAQDVLHSRGIAAGLTLFDKDEFDLPINLSLTTKGSNEVKRLCKDRNQYRYIPSTVSFDYLPKKNRKHDPAIFYELHFAKNSIQNSLLSWILSFLFSLPSRLRH